MEELCRQLDWSFLAAAPSFSAFSGLAASLVLASMVMVLVEYRGAENPTSVVALFTITFMALGSDTFIFGAASGEMLCGRGMVQGMLAGSTLATGVSILMLGVTLLQAKFEHSHAGLTLLGNVVTSMSAAGTMALMSLWSVRLVDSLTVLQLRPPSTISYVPALILIGIFLALIAVIALTRLSSHVRERAVIVTACAYLLHIFITLLMYAVTVVVSTAQWTVHTSSVILYITVTIATLFPFIELTGVVMSLDWRGGRLFWH